MLIPMHTEHVVVKTTEANVIVVSLGQQSAHNDRGDCICLPRHARTPTASQVVVNSDTVAAHKFALVHQAVKWHQKQKCTKYKTNTGQLSLYKQHTLPDVQLP
uniref:Signal peptidase complex catalytic subunit SEC11A n=1 Tax=Lygus hesperus TaxID=30085 RepID=A0A0A9VPQ2_LYGHE